MASLTPQQIAQLAYNAGFRGNDLNTAVAIAMAESGGNPAAYNPEAAAGTPNGHGSRGLWQIYGFVHPKYDGQHAFDPKVNAQAAYEIYRQSGGRFTAWSTYNLGWAKPKQDYARMIKGSNNVKIPASNLSGQATSSTGNAVNNLTQKIQEANPLSTIADVVGWLRDRSGDVFLIGLGSTLMILAIIAFLWMGLKEVDKSTLIKEAVKFAV